MELTSIKDLYRNREQYLNQEITIGGWLRSKRDSKTFGFLVVNDGTFFEPLQVVYSDTLDNFADITKTECGRGADRERNTGSDTAGETAV